MPSLSSLPSLPRVLLPVALAGAALALGVATLVSPPHSTAEAAPPPNSEIPTQLVCRSGGAMRLDVGPNYHLLHYKIRPGVAPKSYTDIKPGECASGNNDIPLGSATVPSLRILAQASGISPYVGFQVSVSAAGVTSLRGVAQPRCLIAGEPQCAVEEHDKAHAAELEGFARAIQSEGKLFQFRITRDPDRPLAPVTSLRPGEVSFPRDN